MALSKDGKSTKSTRIMILGDNNSSASIVKALASSWDVHVTSATAETSTPDATPTRHRCDLSASSLRSLLTDLQPYAVISTVSGGSFETQERIISSVLECGISRFIPCEFGQDSLNNRIGERLPPSGEKAKIIDYLKDLSSREELSWVGIAVGTILDQGLLSGNLGFDIKWQSATFHGSGSERFAASSAVWIGKVVEATLKNWDVVKNQYLYASGLITSANDIVDLLQRETGKEWTVGKAEVDECVREGERRIERGFPDAGMFLMERSILYDAGLDAVDSFIRQDAKELLKLPNERLEDIIQHVVHDHKHHRGKFDCGCG